LSIKVLSKVDNNLRLMFTNETEVPVKSFRLNMRRKQTKKSASFPNKLCLVNWCQEICKYWSVFIT